MNISTSKVTFANTRTRFQRLEDAKLFSGWVNSLSPKGIIVCLKVPMDAQAGQRFRFEVFGTGALAVFEARLEILSGTLAAFVLTTSVKTLPSKEDTRLKTKETHVKLFLMPKAEISTGAPDLDQLAREPSTTPIAEGEVADLSGKGLGVHSSVAIAKGERLRVEIETPWGKMDGIADVRYCKREGEQFRIGLSFSTIDRLNQGLYERLIRRSAAA